MGRFQGVQEAQASGWQTQPAAEPLSGAAPRTAPSRQAPASTLEPEEQQCVSFPCSWGPTGAGKDQESDSGYIATKQSIHNLFDDEFCLRHFIR